MLSRREKLQSWLREAKKEAAAEEHGEYEAKELHDNSYAVEVELRAVIEAANKDKHSKQVLKLAPEQQGEADTAGLEAHEELLRLQQQEKTALVLPVAVNKQR